RPADRRDAEEIAASYVGRRVSGAVRDRIAAVASVASRRRETAGSRLAPRPVVGRAGKTSLRLAEADAAAAVSVTVASAHRISGALGNAANKPDPPDRREPRYATF